MAESREISRLKPMILMVVNQILYSVTNIMYKLVVVVGMNLNVLFAYRLLFSIAFTVPMAELLKRKGRPKITKVVLFQAFLCGLLGATLAQNLYILCLAFTSPTFVAAIYNLLPAMTFVIAVCFRQEKLGLGSKSYSGIAKIAGTLVGIGGAMLFTFYKGPIFTLWNTHIDILKPYRSRSGPSSSSHRQSPGLGFLAGAGSNLCFAMWLIVQSKMSKNYPHPYTCTALMCCMGSIQSLIFALCMERDRSQWKMGWDIRLWTAAYTGIVVSGVLVVLMTWCVQQRGPVFVSAFTPLTLLVVALASSFCLGEKFSLGSVLGGILIVYGLYMVLWGKINEEPMVDEPVVDEEKN